MDEDFCKKCGQPLSRSDTPDQCLDCVEDLEINYDVVCNQVAILEAKLSELQNGLPIEKANKSVFYIGYGEHGWGTVCYDSVEKNWMIWDNAAQMYVLAKIHTIYNYPILETETQMEGE